MSFRHTAKWSSYNIYSYLSLFRFFSHVGYYKTCSIVSCAIEHGYLFWYTSVCIRSWLGSWEGNGTPLQYSCLKNPMGGGAWWAAVHGVAKSQTGLHFHFHFSLSCIGEGNGNPLQCSCLENPRDRGAWRAAVYGVAQSRTRLKWLSSSSSSTASGTDGGGHVF